MADKLGARRFNIPMEIWKRMSPPERWTANQKFLDRTITRGDRIVFSNSVRDINAVTGSFRDELDYLIGKGLNINQNGTGIEY